MNSACIVAGARTAFGSFGGALKDQHPIELGRLVARAALERSAVAATAVEEVFFGNVLPADSRSIYLARHIALAAEIPIAAPALTLNRLCGSGLEAVAQAAQGVALGRFNIALAGGVETMSLTPYAAYGARWGGRLGDLKLEDLLLAGLTDRYVDMAMGRTAETLAQKYKISRESQDAWAARSQARAAAARDSGRFAKEIVPVSLRVKKQTVEFAADEFIRPDSDAAALARLPAAFLEGGTVTAGNASGINDGASAVVVASESAARAQGLRPLARILGWASVGCAPEEMGIGPVHAIPRALTYAGLKQADIDLFEINEAFAAQTLAVIQALNLDVERTNVNGGAIALGHPLGASGNRVLLSLCHELAERGLRYGVASLCIGGGQGIAMVVENARL